MAHKVAGEFGIRMREGVYAGVSGPTFETPAEYRYIRVIGADCVGMSTVPEVVAARHMGLRCLAFSVITDLGVPGKIARVTHKEVIDVASTIEPKMTKIIREIVRRLDQ
jgi:purine-nucleoside phosphorylase